MIEGDAAPAVTKGDSERGISRPFAEALKKGELQPILRRVCNDDTLSLEVRNGYVDIYYRGGRLLGLHERGEGAWFHAEFDAEYLGKKGEYRIEPPPELPDRRIAERSDAAAWVDAFAVCKQAMDIRFCLNAKLEREYQQALERDNNRHVSGDESDYAIIDIEYTQSALAIPGRKTDFRFDMVGIRWPAEPRKRTPRAIPVLMEMKVGDGSLTSEIDSRGKRSAGLIKHVEDIEEFLRPELDGTPSLPLAQLLRELLHMLRAKQELCPMALPKRLRDRRIADVDARPEVIFVIANHNPDSTVLLRELKKLVVSDRAEYKVALASPVGYALYARHVVPLEDFIRRLELTTPPPPKARAKSSVSAAG